MKKKTVEIKFTVFFVVILRKITVLQLSMLFVCFGYIVITINFFQLFTHCLWRFWVILVIFRGFDKFSLAWHVSELYHFFGFIAAFFWLCLHFWRFLQFSLTFFVHFACSIVYFTRFHCLFLQFHCLFYISFMLYLHQFHALFTSI